jgi:hypothetical protein
LVKEKPAIPPEFEESEVGMFTVGAATETHWGGVIGVLSLCVKQKDELYKPDEGLKQSQFMGNAMSFVVEACVHNFL